MQSPVVSGKSPVGSPEIGAGQPATVAHRRSPVVLVFMLVIAFGLIALLGYGWLQRQAPPLEAGSAPTFEIKTFEGETIRLADLRGKPVVVNFWASWCVPCRDEAPALQAMWEKYREQGLVVLGVDYVDTESEAKKFIAEFGQTYPNGPDVGTQISSKYKITGVPETYFITRDGKILQGKDATGRALGNYIGPVPARVLEERIQKLLEP
jgi:cytochrome c biogenesis protein CcmG, thiol:disulfide interchange protein DsbE